MIKYESPFADSERPVSRSSYDRGRDHGHTHARYDLVI